jgi:hypothetical protein
LNIDTKGERHESVPVAVAEPAIVTSVAPMFRVAPPSAKVAPDGTVSPPFTVKSVVTAERSTGEATHTNEQSVEETTKCGQAKHAQRRVKLKC